MNRLIYVPAWCFYITLAFSILTLYFEYWRTQILNTHYGFNLIILLCFKTTTIVLYIQDALLKLFLVKLNDSD